MPEWLHGDWVVAIASVVAAVVGGTVIERYRATRKLLRFVVQPPQAVSEGLRSHGTFLEIKIGDRILRELNVASVSVKNAGNVQLEQIAFEIILPGPHSLTLAECIAADQKLKSAVDIDFDRVMPATDQRFKISLPFLNPGEGFVIKTFSDDAPVACRVECRLPGVTAQIETPETLAARHRRFENVRGFLFIPFVLITVIAVSANWYFKLRDESERQAHVQFLEREVDRLTKLSDEKSTPLENRELPAPSKK